ncbi:SDR family oxidoreductase [Oryzobacter sp. R7]|uniref:SDR family oxidoreductase n=1 Tax=Oryzobacter faecalis TaxID=3388656 RepID=UPI00398CB123
MMVEATPLSGSTAVVTGASSGLGRATALRLARHGCDVLLLARRADDLDAVAHEVEAQGVSAHTCAVDLASGDLARVVRDALAQTGPPSVLVNAAGTDAPGPARETSLEDWNRVVAVNLTAPFVLAREVMPLMAARGGGLVVNVSSVAGRRGWAGASAYCSTKFGLTGLTQSLAAEGRADGIRVCLVYPGAMSTGWGEFDDAAPRRTPPVVSSRDSLDPAAVADLVGWMATTPGAPVLNEVTITPLMEHGWP